MATAGAQAMAHPPLAVRLPALAEMLRPGNCAMTAFGVVVGAYVEVGPALPELALPAALAAFAGFAFAGAGNALNDFEDRELDKAAHPARPLPSGRATAHDAALLAGLLFAASAGAAALLGPETLLFVLAALVLMVGYELKLKLRGLPGNLAIGILTGAPFAFGALAVGSISPPVLLLAALATLATLGREIVKDVEDMDADVGRRTLPQTAGAAKARRAAQAALLAGVALSPLPFLVQPGLGWTYLPLVAAADAVLVLAAFAAQPRKAQKLAKLGMLVALVAFAAGRLTA